MKAFSISLVFFFCIFIALAQAPPDSSNLNTQEDFIVIKRTDNRTLHTYFSGAFISATAFNGFNVNGFIKAIRNDSIFVLQQEKQLAGTDFGSKIDTLYYTLGFDYREIERFNFSSKYIKGYNPGMRRGTFFKRVVPVLMQLGGVGFIVLELVNGQYRHETMSSNNKLPSLLIAGAVAVGGFTWSRLQRKQAKKLPSYQVIYMKSGSWDEEPTKK